ncbi:hypothetical protein [Nakamurella deserti]|uniref:hypothetical protein n=1 Tax=Nakamurella deserti TaxID=2164074 RepID=UPI0013005D13|nr:hypothetical protein [Nakamurella deserti]
MRDMVCGACGAHNRRPVDFCASCGAFLAWDEAPDARDDGAPPAADGHPPAVDRPPVDHPPPAAGSAGGFPDDDDVPVARWTFGAAARTTTTHPGPSATPATPAAAAIADPAPAATHDPAPPPRRTCPQCAAPAESGRRFCRRCGFQLVHPAADAAPPSAAPDPRLPWWRWRPGGATRAAWRRSLPLRYRVRRWLFGVLGIGLLIGGLTLIGRDPVGWAADRWNDLRDVQVPVGDLTAVAVPAESADGPGSAAVDRRLDTAWVTPWPAGSAPATDCAAPRTDADPAAPGALLVGLGATREVRTVRIHPGPPSADQRATEPRPRRIQIGWADGCVTVDVPDTAAPVTTAVRISADTVWLSVVEVWPAATPDARPEVSVTEVEFLARP